MGCLVVEINRLATILKNIKMKYISLIFILVIILFDSCKKPEGEVIFKGIVIDYDNDKPFSNQLVKLWRPKPGEINSTNADSSWTNSNGLYQFSFPNDERNHYTVYAPKDKYIGRFEMRIKPYKYYNKSSINYDTVIIGQAAFLNISINNYHHKLYLIKCNMEIPTHLFDPLADYYPQHYTVSENDTNRYISTAYLYKDNNEVFISWSELDPNTGDTLNNTLKTIQLTPMDTTYMTINLQ